MAFWVYILQSESTGKTCVGQTSNLEQRLKQHNDPDFKRTVYTKRNEGPWQLVYSEEFEARAQAMRREKYLRSGAGREWVKDHLASATAVNPPSADLQPGVL